VRINLATWPRARKFSVSATLVLQKGCTWQPFPSRSAPSKTSHSVMINRAREAFKHGADSENLVVDNVCGEQVVGNPLGVQYKHWQAKVQRISEV
jgi:hypothetical protein